MVVCLLFAVVCVMCLLEFIVEFIDLCCLVVLIFV